MSEPNINNISSKIEDRNLENQPTRARVVTHSLTALSQGIKFWKICLVGKKKNHLELWSGRTQRKLLDISGFILGATTNGNSWLDH